MNRIVTVQLPAGGTVAPAQPFADLVLPAFETYPMLGREGDATFPAQSMPIFGKSTVVRADGSRFLAATNDAYEIAEYSPRGELRRLIRVRLPARPVTDADHAAYVAQEMQAIDDFNEGRFARARA